MLFSTFVIATSQYASAESLNQNRFIISAITSNNSASNTAGTLQMWANGINNLGQIVGGEIRQNANGENYVAAYQMHNNQISYLDFGDLNSDATDINDIGQIIGDAWGSTSVPSNPKSVVYQNNTISVLDTSNLFTERRGRLKATDINNRGEISATQDFGDSTTGYLGSAPVIFKNGIAHSIYKNADGSTTPDPFYGTKRAEATALNDNADIVGFGDADGIYFLANAYLLADGKIDIFALQEHRGFHDFSSASDINNHRQVVGTSFDVYDNQYSDFAYIYQDGVIKNLGSFDGAVDINDWETSAALAINDKGQVVGYAYSPSQDGSNAAFLYESGKMINLNDYLKPELGWELTSATDINELGQIIGVGLKNGVLTSYLLTPTELTQVPLPASAWLFGSGFAAFLAVMRKRKRLNSPRHS
jgi:probable HAF family extracellular repeat protein